MPVQERQPSAHPMQTFHVGPAGSPACSGRRAWPSRMWRGNIPRERAPLIWCLRCEGHKVGEEREAIPPQARCLRPMRMRTSATPEWCQLASAETNSLLRSARGLRRRIARRTNFDWNRRRFLGASKALFLHKAHHPPHISPLPHTRLCAPGANVRLREGRSCALSRLATSKCAPNRT
jgi:hypothetical protein